MTKVKTRGQAEQATIEVTAAEWLVRRGEDRSQADDDAFFIWLESDPRHGEVYDALARTWEDVGQLKELAGIPRKRRHFTLRLGTQVWALAAALVAAVTLAVVFLSWREQQTTILPFQTAVAKTRTVTLADGSSITLGGASAIDVKLTDGERRVTLERGEAFFEVAHDASRPFFVEAGGTEVRVLGTVFDVHRGIDGVQVTVLEGRVEVRDARAFTLKSPAVRVLTAGQRTQVLERPAYVAIAAVPPTAEPVTVAEPGGWREGRLSYDDVRLAEVVADVNRYYSPGVRISGEAAGDVRVTAAFRTDQIPSFLDALRETLPVRVQRDGAGGYAIASATD